MPIYQHYSRKLLKTITLTMPEQGGHIKDLDGRQVCEGGGFMGATLSATPQTFERECKKWIKAYIARQPAKYRYDASTDSVYEYRGGCYMFIGRLSGRTLKQFDFDLNFNYN